jgi:hypothetical protein
MGVRVVGWRRHRRPDDDAGGGFKYDVKGRAAESARRRQRKSRLLPVGCVDLLRLPWTSYRWRVCVSTRGMPPDI